MVKRKTVSMSRSRGTVRRHQGISGPSREITRPTRPSGPSRERTRPARHKPRFLGHFHSLGELFRVRVHVRSHRANYFAPRAQGCHNFETNGITKRPPRYKTLPARERRLIMPKMHKHGEFCTARRAHELAGRVFNRTSRAHPTSTGNKPEPAAPSAGHGVTLTWLTIRIGYDDADRLISYPDAHNLSR